MFISRFDCSAKVTIMLGDVGCSNMILVALSASFALMML